MATRRGMATAVTGRRRSVAAHGLPGVTPPAATPRGITRRMKARMRPAPAPGPVARRCPSANELPGTLFSAPLTGFEIGWATCSAALQIPVVAIFWLAVVLLNDYT